MRTLRELFVNNMNWADRMQREDPDFFRNLAGGQRPGYMWIGCSDSRVPANEIVGLLPGEVFVHRNVANLVHHSDLNILSAIQFAVDQLQVRHIIICGHYGCGGVKAALSPQSFGLIDNWLMEIKDLHRRHHEELQRLEDDTARRNRLCELNVAEQVERVCHTNIVQRAWHRGQEISVHGWIYDLNDGLLRDLGLCVSGDAPLSPSHRLEPAPG